MKPIVIFCEKDDKVTMTKEEFEKTIQEVAQKAYDEGIREGYTQGLCTANEKSDAHDTLTPVFKYYSDPDYNPYVIRGASDGALYNPCDIATISTTSTPQTGSYTATTTATNSAPSAPTITNSATIDWARTKLSNKDKE